MTGPSGRAFAEAQFAELTLSANNARLVQYWLSLWTGDALPRRADFRPASVRDLLPGLALFDVVPGKSMRCRLAGAALEAAIGGSAQGLDILARTPEPHRAEMLALHSAVVEGHACIGVKRFRAPGGEVQLAEQVKLPFGDVGADGTRTLVFHTNWRPDSYLPAAQRVLNLFEGVDETRLVPLTRPA